MSDSPAPLQCTRHPLLYEDTDLLAVFKPAGVLSHPNPARPGGAPVKSSCTFEGPYDFAQRCFQTPRGPIWLIHRLDQDTSGVLLAARSKAAAEACVRQFDEQKIKKNYLALVMGQVSPAQGRWSDFIAVQKGSGRLRARIIKGQPFNAKLLYHGTKNFPHWRLSLLKIELITGKTHQIRIQSAFRGHPVVGDEIYGHFAFNKRVRKELGLKRIFLHAASVELSHPVTGKPLLIEAPLPEDLQSVLTRLS